VIVSLFRWMTEGGEARQYHAEAGSETGAVLAADLINMAMPLWITA
jgi:hypothetical protein